MEVISDLTCFLQGTRCQIRKFVPSILKIIKVSTVGIKTILCFHSTRTIFGKLVPWITIVVIWYRNRWGYNRLQMKALVGITQEKIFHFFHNFL